MAQIDHIKDGETAQADQPTFGERLQAGIDLLDHLTGGWVTIVRQSVARFTAFRGFEAAASLAYYALFSLFPLTLVLASLLGFFFRGEMAYTRAVGFIRTVFPFSGELIDRELREIFTQMGTFGILGVLGLLWAASGFFTVLARNINMAWPRVKLRGLVQGRLVALGMLGGLIILMLFSILTTTLVGLLPAFLEFVGGNGVLTSPGWIVGLRILSIAFTYLMFVAVYQWVPNKSVNWKAVLIGALVATIAWELARLLFTLFLSSGLARYQFVYGSLGALIALMVWIYFGNSIVLFGATMVATLDIMAEQQHMEQEKSAEISDLPDETETVEPPASEQPPAAEPTKNIRG